jgi:hypothetical protein
MQQRIIRPAVYNGDIANLPIALRPLTLRPQWVVWKLTWRQDHWSKVPYRCDDPSRFASSADPNSWSAYETAVAAAANADGVSFMLAPGDPFAALDIDRVRDPVSGSVVDWAQRLIDQAGCSYVEISPSGCGLRIWGLTTGGEPLHRKFSFEHGALELFRRTRKALTVTGLLLGGSKRLGNIDALLDRAVAWGARHKSKNAASPRVAMAGTVAGLGLGDINLIVENGAPEGANRSDVFHAIVGHYYGCSWSAEQIVAELEQHPEGIGARYIAEHRLEGEVARCIEKYEALRNGGVPTQEWANGWQAPEPPPQQPQPKVEQPPEEEPAPLDEYARLEAEERQQAQEGPELDEGPGEPELPPMYCHGDARPARRWMIRKLIPECGHGLLSGQWGTYKSFIVLDLAAALITGQPFLSYIIDRQCGVLFLLAEGAEEMSIRLDAVVREKCGDMKRAPIRWFEECPTLLAPGALGKLVVMARQAHESLMAEFGLPLGLIVVDTLAASAGYAGLGAENDNSIGQQLMNVLKLAALRTNSFALGVDHFGKIIDGGTRGGSSKEASVGLVLACLGKREMSGRVTDMRLAVRKNRGGISGQEFPFSVREVHDLGQQKDESTLIIQWEAATSKPAAQPAQDPWDERRMDARQGAQLLKRTLMAKMAAAGVELPGEPVVRGIDREIVRAAFYEQTPVDGTEKEKAELRRKRFNRTLDRAIEKQLIEVREVGSTTYLWLLPQQPEEPGPDEEF